ncbi:hypothetical protein QOY93_02220 [Leclercia adecarboxylata]|uniref:hypothetical protein n=1 Tax=Leclercia adecarboxylata TaxID=83655 RepID=UPI00254CFF5D|nr:hypothetical protein [Leclercia adecarboxylata]MDK4744202.1 hypothetical protein [Leclercia adecarboxylata]
MKDPAALRAAEEQLRAGGNASPTPQEIADQAGRTAMAQYGTGSDIQRAIQAATAAVKGAAGGDLSAALAGAAAPYVAEVIGHRSGLDDGMGKAAAHAAANAALAALQGQNALAGAAGAVAGKLAGSIAKAMYGKLINLRLKRIGIVANAFASHFPDSYHHQIPLFSSAENQAITLYIHTDLRIKRWHWKRVLISWFRNSSPQGDPLRSPRILMNGGLAMLPEQCLPGRKKGVSR